MTFTNRLCFGELNQHTFSGASANAGPHYQKLYARVTHVWGNRKGQPDRSAMKGPRLERTASLITVPPASGKFFCVFGFGQASSPKGGAMLPGQQAHPSRGAGARPQGWSQTTNGGSPRCQLRQGIEPCLHLKITQTQQSQTHKTNNKTEQDKTKKNKVDKTKTDQFINKTG